MKRKVLKSSLFIFSLVTLTAVGVNATENSTVTSSTNEAKTEFKVEATEDTNSSESEEPLQPKTVFTPEEEMKENKESVSSERTINSTEIKKDSDKQIEELYEYAISTGKIKRDLYSLNDFVYNYKSSLEYYPELQRVLNLQESFEEWFEQINFGALPDGQGEAYPDDNFKDINKRNFDTRAFSNAQKRNAERFKKDLRKGDIIVVAGTPGHAAIATTNGYILEMTGGRNPFKWFTGGYEKNNHQFKADNWLYGKPEQGWYPDQNINYKIQIWRIPNSKIANQVANYADKKYYSSTGSYKRNINLKYLISPGPLVTNPNYCSKLVFNAYWYGSGNAPVVKDYYAHVQYIYPSALPDIFNKSYAPRKIGDY